jgi:UDP-glucose 4-epimerase
MTVWITGANGFIGRHLARALADAGQVVHGIGHGAIHETERRRLGLQSWLNGEIDAANLSSLASLQGLPSAIFHLAGGSSVGLSIAQPFEDFSRTVTSTARLLEWLRSTAPECRLVVASSAAVYGAGRVGPIGEDAAPAPMSPYGQHKRIAEELCESYAKSYGIRSTVARLFSVYGANLRKQLLWDVCAQLKQREDTLVLGGTGAEMRDWTDVRDIVRLLAKLRELAQPQPYWVINGGSGQGTSVAEIIATLVRHWGKKVAVAYSGVARAGDPISLIADATALRRLQFDWQIPVDQGIADYVRWFKDRVR